MKYQATRRFVTGAIALSCVVLAPAAVARAEEDTVTWSLGGLLHTVVEPALGALSEDAAHGTTAALGHEALEAVGEALMVGEIAGRVITQLGYKVQVDTVYSPEDPPDTIHLQEDHTKPLSDKSITLEAKVEFTKDWEDKLPAPTLRKVLGMGLPEEGPAKDAKVDFYFPDKLFRYVTVLDSDFNAGTNPTFASKTDGTGVAKGTLHPAMEDFHFGGIRKVEVMKVKAVAEVQAAQGLPHGKVSAVAPMVDMLLATAQGTGIVRIERHVPTEWEGTVTIDRSVNASWSVTRPIPASQRDTVGMFSTKAAGTEAWQGTLTMPAAHFTTGGVGSGDYDYKITGDQSIHQVRDGKIQCENDEKPRPVTETLDIKGHGEGEEVGTGGPQLRIRDLGGGKLAYAVSWMRPGTGLSAISPPRFGSNGSSEHRWTDCDGSHDVQTASSLTSRLAINQQMLLGGPTTPNQNLWLPFDPDAKELVGHIEWEDEPSLGPDAPTFWVSTGISWNIHRIIPPGLGTPAAK